jgi:hypothetical protein
VFKYKEMIHFIPNDSITQDACNQQTSGQISLSEESSYVACTLQVYFLVYIQPNAKFLCCHQGSNALL